VFGTPVAEYLPPRLVRNRVALAPVTSHVPGKSASDLAYALG
jgi:hypothetical protein